MSDNRQRPFPCECGFWDRDRPHSAVGGGTCKYAYDRRTGQVDHTGDIAIPDEVVDLKLLLAARAEIARLIAENERLRAALGPWGEAKWSIDGIPLEE